jgi:hypothetical protein
VGVKLAKLLFLWHNKEASKHDNDEIILLLLFFLFAEIFIILCILSSFLLTIQELSDMNLGHARLR